MIRNKEYFSQKPFGMIWLCTECDHIHLRYGSSTVTLNDQIVDELLSMACQDEHPLESCSGCNKVHLDCQFSTLHIDNKDFDQLLLALYRFVLKTPPQTEKKLQCEQVYQN